MVQASTIPTLSTVEAQLGVRGESSVSFTALSADNTAMTYCTLVRMPDDTWLFTAVSAEEWDQESFDTLPADADEREWAIMAAATIVAAYTKGIIAQTAGQIRRLVMGGGPVTFREFDELQ